MTANPAPPCSPDSGQLGFEISSESGQDSESSLQEVELRLATLRVDDEDWDDPFEQPLTYRLSPLGLTVVLFPGRDGPVVDVSADTTVAVLVGLPVTVIVEDVHDALRRYAHYLR